MKNSEIYDTWTRFINHDDYKSHFLSNKEQWFLNFEKMKKFLSENKKRPSKSEDKQLFIWISSQVKKSKNRIQIMLDDEIFHTWSNFVQECEYF